ncbi:MAG: DUF6316 family protein [Pseudomonadales bacterium]
MSDKRHRSQRRKGESGVPPERRSRTFFSGDGWYFMTRERVDVGPFNTQAEAESGVQDYIGLSLGVEHIPAEPIVTLSEENEEPLEEDDLP